jgi:hypothetical protein
MYKGRLERQELMRIVLLPLEVNFSLQGSEGFRSIENKKFPTMTKKNKPRSDLQDAKQRAGEIRSTYPCRSHSGNVHMNMVGVVILASPPR